MKRTDFYYNLPEELIAQTPIEPRDSSRLLVVDRQSGNVSHRRFYELAELLNVGDLLVLNDSRVFPARLYGRRRAAAGKIACDTDVELLLLEQKTADLWEAMVRPGRRLKKGAVVDFGSGLSAEIVEVVDGGNRLVRFDYDGDFFELLEKIGNMPLPPYITKKLDDGSRYNTIYSRETGSAAAPTAGLHFTERVFTALKQKGIDTAFTTLHVGAGTFRPVKADNILEHKMHSERFSVTSECAKKIADCKERGGRVIAVGTTSCRVLESIGSLERLQSIANGNAAAWFSTDIFIYPGYNFGLTDCLLTNFHLPESTLIMLVSALLGREKTLAAYEQAIRERYRFFSFGDAMLIL